MCGRRLHNSQVAFYETMWLQRPGVMPRPVLLRANKCFRGRERRHAVLVKASNGEIWIAVLILFIKCIFNDEVFLHASVMSSTLIFVCLVVL